MRHNKHQQFTERLSTAASARRAMLEKFQARRTVEDVEDPAVRERRAAQAAQRAARETSARRPREERGARAAPRGGGGGGPPAPPGGGFSPRGAGRAKRPNAN